ncbi:MAG: hypothetical protein G01um101491_112 [Parcubacteria group bacterium Gr01-1014_91]|nr:MAG: hypothetical protein G01um101491_112 [Parcubacteria group bacterium Gr01-1014_91]
MPKPDIRLIRVKAGFLAYYTLDELTKRQKNIDPSEFGICGVENYFWIGKRIIQSGEDVLRLSLSKIWEKRNNTYPTLADGKVYIFVGTNKESGKFEWFLLNEEKALQHIAPKQQNHGKTTPAGPVIHQVRLADLICLAELWEVSSNNLGLEINAKGELVPKIIDGEDDLANLSQIQNLADEAFPENDELDLVVEVEATGDGSKMKISTMDYVFSPKNMKRNVRWWTFTDTYRENMDS